MIWPVHNNERAFTVQLRLLASKTVSNLGLHGLLWKVTSGLRSKFSNLSHWKDETQGFNGSQTRDLRDTGAMLGLRALGEHRTGITEITAFHSR